jgi:hypothetical protein
MSAIAVLVSNLVRWITVSWTYFWKQVSLTFLGSCHQMWGAPTEQYDVIIPCSCRLVPQGYLVKLNVIGYPWFLSRTFKVACKYLSGETKPSGFGSETSEKVVSTFNKFDISTSSCTSSREDDEPGLWLVAVIQKVCFLNVDFTGLPS